VNSGMAEGGSAGGLHYQGTIDNKNADLMKTLRRTY
jgi:hypothetical protein